MLWAIGGKTYIYVLLHLGTGEALAQDAHGLDGCFEETFKPTHTADFTSTAGHGMDIFSTDLCTTENKRLDNILQKLG